MSMKRGPFRGQHPVVAAEWSWRQSPRSMSFSSRGRQRFQHPSRSHHQSPTNWGGAGGGRKGNRLLAACLPRSIIPHPSASPPCLRWSKRKTVDGERERERSRYPRRRNNKSTPFLCAPQPHSSKKNSDLQEMETDTHRIGRYYVLFGSVVNSSRLDFSRVQSAFLPH